MRSLIALVPFCAILLSSASPLGDRAVFRRHSGAGVPLARRFILASRWDAPPACAAGISPPSVAGNATVADNSTITPPNLSNVTDLTGSDNSTSTTPNVTATPVDANATTSANTTSADTTTASNTTKRYGDYDWEDAWFELCMDSCGDIYDSDPCFDFTINGFSALSADANVCAQQETADGMISWAKSRGGRNTADLINVAQVYRQIARESVEIMGIYPSTPYCTTAPINSELMGICNEQPEGVTRGLYGGPNYPIVSFGDGASCPYGQTPDVTTCSCVGNFFGGNVTDTSAANSTMTDMTSDTVESTAVLPASAVPTGSAASVVASSVAPSVVASSVAPSVAPSVVASSTAAAPVAAATNPGGISGDINDPNGR
ncbi:hypothetical protein C8R44DRAFT_29813 [Mycena epipterygia]|nr:hypothetical protein C8R44DRAFT_29813 [Mycena epipterygia]